MSVKVKRKKPASASVKRRHGQPVNVHGWPHDCNIKTCKNIAVYAKRNQKTGEMEHWCAADFKEHVEDHTYVDDPKWKAPKEQPKKKAVRRVRKK